MTGTFRLALKVEGSNPIYWESLDTLIGQANIPINPDASFAPQSEVVKALSGRTFGRGFASALWHWNVISNDQRATLREFCPGTSSEVYIETPTNEETLCGETEFIQALAIMHWPAGDEEQQSDKTLGLEIGFTHLVEVS
jgi:hypothetical protein